MKNKATLIMICLIFSFAACNNKEPYEPPAYTGKAVVIGQEKCSIYDENNYWLLDFSIENKSPEKGDTITYNGTVYNHTFRTLSLDSSLEFAGKKISITFNFSTSDHAKTQFSNCNAPDAETFSLIDVMPFRESEIP